jgi:Uma2 family endonuclease
MRSRAKLAVMNIAVHAPMTLTDFLAWEARQELRHEFDGKQAVAMAGGTAAHARIQRNLAIAIGTRLRGAPCEFLGSDFKIQVQDKIRYPDGFVVCAPVPNNATIIHDPVVIFEVLSPSTASIDRTVKTREYIATPSVQRYVMIEQDRIATTIYVRAGPEWTVHILLNDAMLAMPEIGVELPLSELYEGLTFDSEESTDIATSP